jgi:hypothetical protein
MFFVLNGLMQFLVFRYTLPTLLWSKGLMECAIELGSGGMIDVPSSMTIDSAFEFHCGYYGNNLRAYNNGRDL